MSILTIESSIKDFGIKYAYKHKMYSQINECINIENSMMHYKSVMYDKDLL